MSNKVINHNHDGLDSNKISASNIDINISGLEAIKGKRLEDIIKNIDEKVMELINKGIDIEKGDKDGNILIFNDKIYDSGVSLNDFSNKNHTHSEYLEKRKVKKEGNVLVTDNRSIYKESDLNVEDIVKKVEMERKVDKINIKNNNNIIVSDKDNNFKESEINLNDISLRNHSHFEYEKKIVKGSEGGIVIKSSDGLDVSDIKLSDIVKKDEIKIDGKENDIIILKDGRMRSSGVNINNLVFVGHKHNMNDIINFKIDRNLIKEIVKEILKEILDDMKGNL